MATQRPDTKALDSQIKANLTGVVCFQMANDASSITVLGNGRATDLSPQPGRAIWKVGGEMLEVQTPFLDVKELSDFTTAEKSDVDHSLPSNSDTEVPVKNVSDERSIPMVME